MAVIRVRKGDPIVVDWVDSMSWGGWQSSAGAVIHLQEDTIHQQTIAMLLGYDHEGLVVAQSRGIVWDNVAEVLKIPWGSITAIHRKGKAIDRASISENHSLYLGAPKAGQDAPGPDLPKAPGSDGDRGDGH